MSLVCRGVGVERGGARVLDGVDAAFDPGAITLVAGAVGSGKSTLLAVLGGLLRPTAGEVLDGEEVVSRWTGPHRDRWRRQVGVALQSPHLLPGLTALETAMLRAVPRARSLAALRREAGAALEAVGLSDLAGRPATTLSGGERQRLALARALVGAPRILLVDEPTAHQDAGGTSLVAAVLRQARDRGAVVVVASHDPRLDGVADTRLALAEGRLA